MKIKDTGVKLTLNGKGADLSLWVRVDCGCLGTITVKSSTAQSRQKRKKKSRKTVIFRDF